MDDDYGIMDALREVGPVITLICGGAILLVLSAFWVARVRRHRRRRLARRERRRTRRRQHPSRMSEPISLSRPGGITSRTRESAPPGAEKRTKVFGAGAELSERTDEPPFTMTGTPLGESASETFTSSAAPPHTLSDPVNDCGAFSTSFIDATPGAADPASAPPAPTNNTPTRPPRD